MVLHATKHQLAKHRLVLGGSFNPIHFGHLICARAVAETLGFERVVLVPSAQPPHKPLAADLAVPEHRAAMTRLACQDSAGFEVNDLELKRKGPSYTIDTVRQLKSEGWGKINWLIGADMVQILPQWHQPEALLQEVNFILMARPEWRFDWDKLPKIYHCLKKNVVSAPMIQISATEIRQRIKLGRSIDFLTPDAVVKYITRNKLYC